MTRPGSGTGNGTSYLFEFFVEMRVARIHFRLRNRGKIFVAQIPCPQHLAVAALEPAVLVGRKHHQALAAVAGNRHGLRQGFVLIAAEMLLKLRRGYRNHRHKTSNLSNLPIIPKMGGKIKLCLVLDPGRGSSAPLPFGENGASSVTGGSERRAALFGCP